MSHIYMQQLEKTETAMNELKITEGTGHIPTEPDWAEIYTNVDQRHGAQKYWSEIVHEMKEAGTISPVNGHAILRVVVFRIEFDDAQMNIALKGRLTSGQKKSGGQQVNSNWGCMCKAAEMLMQLEAELGLSPRRRAAATKVNRGKKKDTAASTYLKAVG